MWKSPTVHLQAYLERIKDDRSDEAARIRMSIWRQLRDERADYRLSVRMR